MQQKEPGKIAIIICTLHQPKLDDPALLPSGVGGTNRSKKNTCYHGTNIPTGFLDRRKLRDQMNSTKHLLFGNLLVILIIIVLAEVDTVNFSIFIP